MTMDAVTTASAPGAEVRADVDREIVSLTLLAGEGVVCDGDTCAF
jgi:hypothetical protein